MPDIVENKMTDDADQGTLQEDFAGYMLRNWTPDQVLEFALRLIGTFEPKIILEVFSIWKQRGKCPRDQQVSFCLHILGDEAQAWWARKEAHQE